MGCVCSLLLLFLPDQSFCSHFSDISFLYLLISLLIKKNIKTMSVLILMVHNFPSLKISFVILFAYTVSFISFLIFYLLFGVKDFFIYLARVALALVRESLKADGSAGPR